MKMSLVTMALLGITATASAQSSVTLFGIVDTTLAFGRGSVDDRTQMLRGGLNSNRLGFRGVEDLGSGLSAQFWLEAGFNADDGSGQASNSNNQASGSAPAIAGSQGLTFNRRSTISLVSAQMGELRLGRDFDPQYGNLVNGDAFAHVGVGAAVNYTAIITGVTNTRASNQIAYFTPNTLGGFFVHVAHYRGENPSGAATSKDGTGNALRVGYKSGPLTVAAAWGRTKYSTGDARQDNATASYDFGVVKLMGTFSRDQLAAVKARGGSFGVTAPLGAGELRASYSQYRINSGIASPTTKKWALGYVHNLSKRTALYTSYARLDNSRGATLALNGSITGANQSSSGLDLGIRHSF